MPTNVYGDNDNFNKVTGHVIPAIISKIEEAKKTNKKSVKLLGTGKPLREFIHTDDLAESIVKCLLSCVTGHSRIMVCREILGKLIVQGL